jgi:hypothetical protein
MRRPQSLSEVGRIALREPGRFWQALDEFLDTFYLDHGDIAAQADRIACAPPVLGDPRLDAWTGAVGEHLADRWHLSAPDWCARPAHFRLPTPHFVPDTPSLRALLVDASPPAFRARGIYTVAEPLHRARFPREARRGPCRRIPQRVTALA